MLKFPGKEEGKMKKETEGKGKDGKGMKQGKERKGKEGEKGK